MKITSNTHHLEVCTYEMFASSSYPMVEIFSFKIFTNKFLFESLNGHLLLFTVVCITI